MAFRDEFTATSLEVVMKEEVAHAAQYGERLATLERSLNERLKVARDRINIYSERKAHIQDHIRTAKKQDSINVPMILKAADKALETVHDVEWKLPTIRSQLLEIRKVYDLGRRRAQKLQAEMEWKAKTDFEQWRSTLLGKSPLSAQQVKKEWARLFRRLFWISLGTVVFFYFFLTALRYI
ncbi:hypothetical protein M422DRAFT_23885 [Sphaerobolus stellatus SS14]|nr:hypothetical protein M422DRAFT_23885 [Sphaerobolus stellatus SS14]